MQISIAEVYARIAADTNKATLWVAKVDYLGYQRNVNLF